MEYKIEIRFVGHFYAREAESLSEAAERQGFRVPVSCRNGVCWLCDAQLSEGLVIDPSQSAEYIKQGTIRMCKAVAKSDCVIEAETIRAPGDYVVNDYACQVVSVELMGLDVYRVLLRIPAGKKLAFSPGQYLALQQEKGEEAYFSIASLPGQREIELHIQVPEGRESASSLLASLKQEPVVRVRLPFGKACLNALPEGPVLLIAAGTGFAQIKSIAEALFDASFSHSVDIYWGGRQASELYAQEIPKKWAEEHPNVRYFPVHKDVDDNDWSGHHDQLVEQILKNRDNLASCQVFASGSPGMVYTAMDGLLGEGLPEGQFYSDVLEYAPR
ncbi:CDP-6-deoxy-delta-3,4-glucoseen reductase [Oleiphilus messinensis]|uniref:CDP-6-deoxy-delta-3,4-glucoseen reductase n=1 Tax=Oleiphilus messinensis TaxID=141451 RepID=A0A1Y0I1Y6_9GAMM|nr:2Fe-2S iron-sulfur cluster-binding protein [Oleiphilus messinensis]ARU54472.1 CDP-6-deoxy-delta-3,4-glucoseen reductase [Oleiphilus messinensis]